MRVIKRHFEWVVFLAGLILMATMDPYTTAPSFCLLERFGFPYCPGDGLGHSIAFLFRGEFSAAIKSNLFGPLAVAVLSYRIFTIWHEMILNKKEQLLTLE